jgi:hypothetical protein
MIAQRISCSLLLTALVCLSACSPPADELSIAPPSAPAAAVSMETSAPAANTPLAADAQPVKVDPSILSTTDPAGYTKKDLENIIQHLDWHAENYISQMNKIPTMDELKAWRHPDFRLGLPEWPKPPAGKKWVMNERSGQFSLADEIAAK